MINEEIERKIYFAENIIGVIKHVKCPMLMYDEEKEVAKEALQRYIDDLRMEQMGK